MHLTTHVRPFFRPESLTSSAWQVALCESIAEKSEVVCSPDVWSLLSQSYEGKPRGSNGCMLVVSTRTDKALLWEQDLLDEELFTLELIVAQSQRSAQLKMTREQHGSALKGYVHETARHAIAENALAFAAEQRHVVVVFAKFEGSLPPPTSYRHLRAEMRLPLHILEQTLDRLRYTNLSRNGAYLRTTQEQKWDLLCNTNLSRNGTYVRTTQASNSRSWPGQQDLVRFRDASSSRSSVFTRRAAKCGNSSLTTRDSSSSGPLVWRRHHPSPPKHAPPLRHGRRRSATPRHATPHSTLRHAQPRTLPPDSMSSVICFVHSPKASYHDNATRGLRSALDVLERIKRYNNEQDKLWGRKQRHAMRGSMPLPVHDARIPYLLRCKLSIIPHRPSPPPASPSNPIPQPTLLHANPTLFNSNPTPPHRNSSHTHSIHPIQTHRIPIPIHPI